MQFIKNYILALKVCKKYGADYSPFRDINNGSYSATEYVGKVYKKVSVNPFRKNFKAVLLHEIGHLRLWCNKESHMMYFKHQKYGDADYGVCASLTWKGTHLIPLLEEEARASRFAARVCKNTKDTEFLVKAFQTYSNIGYEAFLGAAVDTANILKYTDVVYKCIRSIEK